MQLSKLENLAYEELKKNNLEIFQIKDLSLVLNINNTKAYNLVKALKKKGVIKKAGKTFFAFKETNELIIGTRLNYPSYVSFWSALNYYGFSDQMPKKIFLATTKYSREINNFKYVTLSKKRSFGYTSIGEITIAEKEKAIIDSLLLPKYAGGLKEVAKCLQAALNQIGQKRLINYALKMQSKAVIRRLGYLLENMNCNKESFKALRQKIGKGYERLDPSLKKKNNLNKTWLLDINW